MTLHKTLRSSPDPPIHNLSSSSAMVPQRQNVDLSDDDLSTEVSSSSDESDNNFDDSDNWVDEYKSIFDFQFDPSSSGIKIDISDTAKDSPIEIFNKLCTDDILETIVSSTNNHGQNLTLKNRSHNKNSGTSTFKIPIKKRLVNFWVYVYFLGLPSFLCCEIHSQIIPCINIQSPRKFSQEGGLSNSYIVSV